APPVRHDDVSVHVLGEGRPVALRMPGVGSQHHLETRIGEGIEDLISDPPGGRPCSRLAAVALRPPLRSTPVGGCVQDPSTRLFPESRPVHFSQVQRIELRIPRLDDPPLSTHPPLAVRSQIRVPRAGRDDPLGERRTRNDDRGECPRLLVPAIALVRQPVGGVDPLRVDPGGSIVPVPVGQVDVHLVGLGLSAHRVFDPHVPECLPHGGVVPVSLPTGDQFVLLLIPRRGVHREMDSHFHLSVILPFFPSSFFQEFSEWWTTNARETSSLWEHTSSLPHTWKSGYSWAIP